MPRPGQGGEGGGGPAAPPEGGGGPGGGAGGPQRGAPPEYSDGGATDELDEEAARAQFAALQEQIAAAPVEDVIANHAFGLFELAAVHLSRQPAKLPEARMAIDALGGMVEALGDRLGQHAATLREGLAQIRLAYVQISAAAGSADGEATASEPAAGDESTPPAGAGDGAAGEPGQEPAPGPADSAPEEPPAP